MPEAYAPWPGNNLALPEDHEMRGSICRAPLSSSNPMSEATFIRNTEGALSWYAVAGVEHTNGLTREVRERYCRPVY